LLGSPNERDLLWLVTDWLDWWGRTSEVLDEAPEPEWRNGLGLGV